MGNFYYKYYFLWLWVWEYSAVITHLKYRKMKFETTLPLEFLGMEKDQ